MIIFHVAGEEQYNNITEQSAVAEISKAIGNVQHLDEKIIRLFTTMS